MELKDIILNHLHLDAMNGRIHYMELKDQDRQAHTHTPPRDESITWS